MLRFCRVFRDLDHVSEIFEMPPGERPQARPVVGQMVDVPKSRKGQTCKHALGFLKGSTKVWAETKYDGERAQIHVQLPPGGGPAKITIFSKSKRDSTEDRYAVHDIIREALGPGVQHAILDAEMVAFVSGRVDGAWISGNGIVLANSFAEFWRIRRLIDTTAQGARGQRTFSSKDTNQELCVDPFS